MTFHIVKNPPQWLLDGLLKASTDTTPCPDCAAAVGEKHNINCDVARCLNTGSQRLCCDCGKCGNDKWDGKWPNTDKAYEQKLVCFDDISGKIMFDYNRVRLK
jgi:hypothetical protein